MKTTSEVYHIPMLSLRDHAYKVTLRRHREAKSVLTTEEEQLIVDWICELQRLGYPITLTGLRLKVADIYQTRENSFTAGILGRGWLRWWKRHHPKLSLRVSQGLEISRA
jgi:hypothetical protein